MSRNNLQYDHSPHGAKCDSWDCLVSKQEWMRCDMMLYPYYLNMSMDDDNRSRNDCDRFRAATCLRG